MPRLDQDRQAELESQRIEYAIGRLHELGIQVFMEGEKCLQFQFNGETVRLYPYTGWHTGKSIRDGRGLQKLLNQLKSQ